MANKFFSLSLSVDCAQSTFLYWNIFRITNPSRCLCISRYKGKRFHFSRLLRSGRGLETLFSVPHILVARLLAALPLYTHKYHGVRCGRIIFADYSELHSLLTITCTYYAGINYCMSISSTNVSHFSSISTSFDFGFNSTRTPVESVTSSLDTCTQGHRNASCWRQVSAGAASFRRTEAKLQRKPPVTLEALSTSKPSEPLESKARRKAGQAWFPYLSAG